MKRSLMTPVRRSTQPASASKTSRENLRRKTYVLTGC
jgi:hypothetical protein